MSSNECLTKMQYYGTSIFGSINPSLDSYISQIIFGLLDMIGTLPGLYCLDRYGCFAPFLCPFVD